MFIAYELSDSEPITDVHSNLFGQPQARMHRLIEIGLNTAIFHIDLLLEDNDEVRYQRLLLYQIEDVINLYRNLNAYRLKISIQSRRDDLRTYSISSLSAILKGSTRDGQNIYVMEYPDGTLEVASISDIKVSDLKDLRPEWNDC